MEYIGYIAAFLATISFLPQVILTIRTRDTHSLSLTMYMVFVSGTICWLVHGVVLGSIPIIIVNLITVFLSGVVLTLKVLEVTGHVKPSA